MPFKSTCMCGVGLHAVVIKTIKNMILVSSIVISVT